MAEETIGRETEEPVVHETEEPVAPETEETIVPETEELVPPKTGGYTDVVKAGFKTVYDMPAQHIKLFAPWIFDIDTVDFLKTYKPAMCKEDYKKLCRVLDVEDNRASRIYKTAMDILSKDDQARMMMLRFLEVNPKAVEFEKKILFAPPQCPVKSFDVYYEKFLSNAANPLVIDHIMTVLDFPLIIKYFEHCTESVYRDISKKYEVYCNSKNFSVIWKTRCELLIDLILSHPIKRSPEHWYPELLVACNTHPVSRAVLRKLDPNYKDVITNHIITLQQLEKPPAGQYTEFVDEDAVPNEPRPQSLFGKRPDDITGEYSNEPYMMRAYQEELASKAKQGHGTIICAPTGCGKTLVAIDIMVSHLRSKKILGKVGRIAMFVPTIPLVSQQSHQIMRNTYPEFFVEKISGAERMTDAGEVRKADTVLRADIVVLTPQIFINMLLSPLKSQKLYLTDFTMFIFDECHHCNEQHPYNVLMDHVRQLGYSPQIVGLTASVGDGNDGKSKTKMDSSTALEHMTALCARLNVSTISSVRDPENESELLFHVSRPIDEIYPVRPSSKDDFAHEIALLSDYVQAKIRDELKEAIKDLTEVKDDFDFPYEELQGKNGSVKTSYRYNGNLAMIKHEVDKNYTSNPDRRFFLMKCFELLEIFHFTLRNNELLPAELAFEYFHERINAFDRFDLYKDVKPETYMGQMIARLSEFVVHIKGRLPNLDQYVPASNKKPILNKLIECIEEQYNKNYDSRILIFLDSRKSCAKLAEYLKKIPEIKATFGEGSIAHLVSVNQSAAKYGQSSAIQQEALNQFRQGYINILLATSVAEEGLDVAQCNLIIKYNSVGSEKSYIQRRGRARAKDSRSVLLALNDLVEQSEYSNIMREYLMNNCLKALQAMSDGELRQRINTKKALLLAAMEEEERRMEAIKKSNETNIYKLECATCGLPICKHSEIARLMESQFICCNPYSWKDTTIKSRQQKGFNMGVSSLCGEWICKCGTKRGEVIKYGEAFLPTISPTSFRLKKEEPGKSVIIELEKRTLTWKFFTSKYFVVGTITSSQIRNMINSLMEYDPKAFIEAEHNEKKGIIEALENAANYKRKERRILQD